MSNSILNYIIRSNIKRTMIIQPVVLDIKSDTNDTLDSKKVCREYTESAGSQQSTKSHHFNIVIGKETFPPS